jgi:apolipoprotein N-acyltransferase
MVMADSKENGANLSSRVLWVGSVLFILGILWLYIFEALDISPWGVKLYISMVLLSVFVADRLFVIVPGVNLAKYIRDLNG